MGDYTRIKFCAKLRNDLPAPVLELFRSLHRCDKVIDFVQPTDDEAACSFFSDYRWTMVFRGYSAYFDVWSGFELLEDNSDIKISFNTNLKNYERTIEKFLLWITPYVNEAPGTIIGDYEFEYADEPSTLVYENGSILIKDQHPSSACHRHHESVNPWS